jgi:hypothetical protein
VYVPEPVVSTGIENESADTYVPIVVPFTPATPSTPDIVNVID